MMKFVHIRQHKQKVEPIQRDGSQYIVMEDETAVFRGSVIACKRYVRSNKQEEQGCDV